jgi:hypothetical protein
MLIDGTIREVLCVLGEVECDLGSLGFIKCFTDGPDYVCWNQASRVDLQLLSFIKSPCEINDSAISIETGSRYCLVESIDVTDVLWRHLVCSMAVAGLQTSGVNLDEQWARNPQEGTVVSRDIR